MTPDYPGDMPSLPLTGKEIAEAAIAEAKAEITARREPLPMSREPSLTIKAFLEGLDTLCEASKGAISYTIERQTPRRLKVTTTGLGGAFGTLGISRSSIPLPRGNNAFMGRGLSREYMPPAMLLSRVAKEAVKQGFVP